MKKIIIYSETSPLTNSLAINSRGDSRIRGMVVSRDELNNVAGLAAKYSEQKRRPLVEACLDRPDIIISILRENSTILTSRR